MEFLKYLKEFLYEEDNQNKPDYSKIWNNMILLANDQLDTFGSLFSYFNEFVELYPDFKDSVPQTIIDSISSLTNSGKDIEEQINISHTPIILGPFLPSNQLYLLIDNVITIIHKYLELKKDIPIDYLNFIDNLVLTSIESESLDKILANIKSMLNTPKGPDAIAFFASISEDYYQIESDLDVFVKEISSKYIDNPDYQLSILFLILRFFNSTTGDESFVREKVIPLLASPNDHICHIASHVIIRLIQVQLINNIECLEKVTSLYPQCKSRYLFKVIKRFISESEDDDDENLIDAMTKIGEKVTLFSVKVLDESNDDIIKSYCIDILAEVGQSNPILIEDYHQKVLDISLNLIKEEKFASYPYISYYFLTMLKSFSETTSSQIYAILPTLANSLEHDDKMQNVKKAFELASNIAELVNTYEKCADLLPQVTSFVQRKLSSSVKEERDRSCGVILSCPKKFSDISASEFSAKIIEFVITNNSLNEVKLFTMTLHKLMKHHKIAEVVFDSFTEKVLDGKLPILHGEILPNHIPIQENLFDYLADFTSKYPSNQIVIQKMSEWLDIESGFAQTCKVLNKSISCKSGSEGLCTIIAQKLSEKLKQSENVKERKIILNVLMTIFNNYPSCISPIEEFVDEFVEYLNNRNDEDDEEEEEEEDKDENQSFEISIIKCLIDIYSSQPNLKVDSDAILCFFDFMPFEDDFETYIVKFNNIVMNDKRFKFAKTGLASLYADMLISDVESISKLSESTTDLIKSAFSTIVKNDEIIMKTVRGQIEKSPKHVEALEKLLK